MYYIYKFNICVVMKLLGLCKVFRKKISQNAGILVRFNNPQGTVRLITLSVNQINLCVEGVCLVSWDSVFEVDIILM